MIIALKWVEVIRLFLMAIYQIISIQLFTTFNKNIYFIYYLYERDAYIYEQLGVFLLIGKASDLDHIWPDQIEVPLPELSSCCLVVYIICRLTRQVWSISAAFAQ